MKENRTKTKRTRQTHKKKPVPAKGKGVAYQSKDIISKELAKSFKGKAFRVYGLDLPEIRTVLPTNIPTIRANELRLDNLFELADSTVAIVDYESKYRKKDMIKYLNYLTGIANRYLKEKKDCPALRMIVIYTGDIERKNVSAEYNIGAVKVTLEPAFLSELDSGRIYQHLKCKVEKKEPLDEEELMEFIILPLSYWKRAEKEQKIRETVKLAARLQDRRQQIFVLSGILAFTDKVIDTETANHIRRLIKMTKVGRIIEEEKRQAIAEAEEKSRQALAQAMAEKKRALAKAKAEARQALAKVKAENKQALAKADAENKQALAKAKAENKQVLAKAEAEKKNEKKRADMLQQAARESVLKMIRKNYPTEEIASIVSVFSQDDIESMRKEVTYSPLEMHRPPAGKS